MTPADRASRAAAPGAILLRDVISPREEAFNAAEEHAAASDGTPAEA